MRKRLVMGALLPVTLICLTGCPGVPVSTGTWVFTVDTLEMALDLQDGGSTQVPDPRPPNTQGFAGTATWMQNQSTFTMTQISNDIPAVYTGTVTSSTSMEGTWTMPESTNPTTLAWSAVKL